MKILISNDDGYDAEGIVVLSSIVRKYSSDIVVFAPDSNRSASSFGLTKGSIAVEEVEPNVYKVSGTPSDCMIIALEGFFDWRPDLILSGINLGANLGSDVIYSGTVSVAMQALWHGITGIAFSLCSHDTAHFDTADYVVTTFLRNYFNTFSKSSPFAMSINIPPVALSNWKGFAYTSLGQRGISHPVSCTEITDGNYSCSLGNLSGPVNISNEQDFWAIGNNYASITPLKFFYNDPRSFYDPSWMTKL
ncbi:5'/3'-nucleotidase SurE [Candidatus Ichthyocystis hellenicum]|uniref:5'/3'-nucleotidase SurE n=1 Tax=Candidatus Ichthyocystis hellenicum TaxID=1561003 RepID=UPI000B2BC323|nr:5'/3'-nucleotidase SurE [Candidatus Ichthyocystis hellenicum]